MPLTDAVYKASRPFCILRLVEVSGQRHAPAALEPSVPIVQEAGWAVEANHFSVPGIEFEQSPG
jgi:hypothetical protein